MSEYSSFTFVTSSFALPITQLNLFVETQGVGLFISPSSTTNASRTELTPPTYFGDRVRDLFTLSQIVAQVCVDLGIGMSDNKVSDEIFEHLAHLAKTICCQFNIDPEPESIMNKLAELPQESLLNEASVKAFLDFCDWFRETHPQSQQYILPM